MSKSIFRYLRGEINGFYLTSLYNTLNEFTNDVKEFFIKFKNMQFAEGKIDSETLYNLGRFASIFLVRRQKEAKGYLHMTESHVVDGEEYSERGLYNMETEAFNFEHTSPEAEGDINELATEQDRSSLVGDEEVQGYISSEEEDVIDSEGYVKPEKVLPVPPDEPYSEFYGNKFLFLGDVTDEYVDVSTTLYMPLFKAIQWIRYNGVSIRSLAELVNILCPDGLVTIQSIVPSSYGNYFYVNYVYNDEADVTEKEGRLSLLEYVVNLKFKQYVLSEVI